MSDMPIVWIILIFVIRYCFEFAAAALKKDGIRVSHLNFIWCNL